MTEMKHVAYLIPHTDVTEEMDCVRLLPGYTIHVERMWLGEVTEQAERKMVEEEFPRALKYLKGVAPYICAVFGCTSASAVNGVEGVWQLEKTMTKELGCPSVTVLGAVIREMKELKANHIAVLTPYIPEVNIFCREVMEKLDIPVNYIAGMGIVRDRDTADLKPEQILAFAREQKDKFPEDTDLCFFSCTNLRAAEILPELSEVLGIPCISSNQAVMHYVKSLE